MGTIDVNGPNLFEDNPTDPRFTSLSLLGRDFIRRGLIENVYYRTGGGWLEHDGNSLAMLTDLIKVGDYVDLGNVHGFVEYVYTNSDDEVIALVVVVKSENGILESKVYLLSQEIDGLELEEDHEDLELVDMSEPNLGWRGPVVFKMPTEDKSTWNSIAQAIDRAGYVVDKSFIKSIVIESDLDVVERPGQVQLSYYTIPSESDPGDGAVYSLADTYPGVGVDSESGLVTVISTDSPIDSFDVIVELGGLTSSKTIQVV